MKKTSITTTRNALNNLLYNITAASLIALTSACVATTNLNVESVKDEQDILLSVDKNHIRTHHSLKYDISAPADFRTAGPKHRTAEFSDTPFQISLAAFLREDAAVMTHAESVTDSSGASNYDNLPVSAWPSGEFRSSGPACIDLPPEAIEGEHDPEWLIENGFNPTGKLMFGQYFTTSADYNDEVVISLMLRIDDCAAESSNSKAFIALQNSLKVRRLE